MIEIQNLQRFNINTKESKYSKEKMFILQKDLLMLMRKIKHQMHKALGLGMLLLFIINHIKIQIKNTLQIKYQAGLIV
jgi:hypothetical protein